MSSITFLGTGTSQGVPMIGCDCEVCSSNDAHDNRLRSSVLIQEKGVDFLIDASVDFRYQMLREGVKNIDAILFTHGHKDHTGGLDDVRAFNYILKKGMDVYAEKNVVDILKKDYDYAFGKDPYPGVPEIKMHTITDKKFDVCGVEVTPIRGLHYKLPVLGFRIGNICYITDMNHIEDSEIEKFVGVDILVINSLRRTEHISHFTLSEALNVICKAAPKRAYLTHISHQLGLYADVKEELPENVFLAYDRLKITL
ncbi:MAG: MBL fold metallo-hydrolase [Rikenellaceae bacterium]